MDLMKKNAFYCFDTYLLWNKPLFAFIKNKFAINNANCVSRDAAFKSQIKNDSQIYIRLHIVLCTMDVQN